MELLKENGLYLLILGFFVIRMFRGGGCCGGGHSKRENENHKDDSGCNH